MNGYRFCPHCGSGLVARDTGGVSRLVCPAGTCGFVVWDNPVPVIAAIVETAGRIVLARNVAWPEKVFGLVTGYLERDEAPEAAVARKVAEELGLRAAAAVKPVGLYPFAEKNQLSIAYHVIADGRIVLN